MAGAEIKAPNPGGLSGKLHYRLFLAALLVLTLGGASVIWQQYLGELDHAKRLMAEDLRARAVSLEQSLHVTQGATEALINEMQLNPGSLAPVPAGQLLRMAYNSRGTSDIAKLILQHEGRELCAQESGGPCGGVLGEAVAQPGMDQGGWSRPLREADDSWTILQVAPVPSASAWVAAGIRLASLQKYTFAVHSLDSVVTLVDGDGHILTNSDNAAPAGILFPAWNQLDRHGAVIRAGDSYLAAEPVAGPSWFLIADIPGASLVREAMNATLPLALTVAAILLVVWGGAIIVEIRILGPARAAGERLAQTLGNLEVTFASVSDGIALLDKESRLIADNDRFRALLGPLELAAPPETVEGEDGTLTFQFHNHHDRWVEARLRDWRVGDRAGMVAVLTDVTERREATDRLTAAKHEAEEALETLQTAQSRLVEAEKLAALGELVAGVAHEINTPIGVAMSAATSLVEQTRLFAREIEQGTIRRSSVDNFKGSLTETAGMVERNITRAADLIRQFKQVAVDRASYQRRRFDLRQVVDETVATLYPALKRTNYRIEVEIPMGIAMDGYPGPLGQVITNLVTNALTHAFEERETGSITLTGGPGENNLIELICRDDGIGMPLSVQKRLFEPFFTTKRGRGGSGLGMHIVYSLVTGLMGGDVSVSSRPGEGAEIRMNLPAHAPDSLASAEQLTGGNDDRG